MLDPPVGGFITTYASWRWIFFLNVPLGLIGMVLSALWISNSREEENRPGGLCRSMQFTSLVTLGFADAPPGQMSAATTFASMIQQMTMGIDVAAGAIALRIAALLRHDSASNPTIPDFHLAFVLVGLIALISVLDFLQLDPAAGAMVSGHQHRSIPS